MGLESILYRGGAPFWARVVLRSTLCRERRTTDPSVSHSEVLRLVRGPGGAYGGWGGVLQSMQPRRGDGHWEDLDPSCACPG